MDSGYILFYTTAAAFMAESILKQENVKVRLTPTPRFLSSDCGISAYFWQKDSDEIKDILSQLGVKFKVVQYIQKELEN